MLLPAIEFLAPDLFAVNSAHPVAFLFQWCLPAPLFVGIFPPPIFDVHSPACLSCISNCRISADIIAVISVTSLSWLVVVRSSIIHSFHECLNSSVMVSSSSSCYHLFPAVGTVKLTCQSIPLLPPNL